MYSNETVEELERILDLMVQDRVHLIAAGFNDVAAQNTLIIDQIVSELKKRG